MLALRKPPFNLEVLEQQGKAQPGGPRFIRQQLELGREQRPVRDQFVGFPMTFHDHSLRKHNTHRCDTRGGLEGKAGVADPSGPPYCAANSA